MERTKIEAAGDLGRYAELAFQAEAYRLGFVVYAPLQCHKAVDCVVGVGGKLLRIQIKGRNPSSRAGRILYHIDPRLRFNREDFDILAVFCADTGEWFFTDSASVHGKSRVQIIPGRLFSKQAAIEWSGWEIFTTVVPSVVPASGPLPEPTPGL